MPLPIKKLLLNKNNFRILFGIYTVFLLVVTLMPTNIIKTEKNSWLRSFKFKNEDKVIHFTLFFIFTCLFFASKYTNKKTHLWLFPLLLGVLIEILQSITALGRTFEFYDILANSLGIFIAYFLIVNKT
jgi:VanZ family protein